MYIPYENMTSNYFSPFKVINMFKILTKESHKGSLLAEDNLEQLLLESLHPQS